MRYDDGKWIHPGTVGLYANTNEAFLKGEAAGIVVELPGLGGGSCLGGSMEMGAYDAPHARDMAEKGILLAYMFPGPWSWGGPGAVRMTDGVVAALKEKYHMDKAAPLAVCGGSMGGVGALNYAAYSGHELRGAAAACPCVDVLACFDCRADFARTYVSAVAGCDMPLEEGLKGISPVEQMGRMPRIPYFICSDGEDALFPQAQCDRYVADMRKAGHDVEYYIQPGLAHGGFLPRVREELHRFLIRCILG